MTPQASQASGRSGAIAAAHPEAVRAGLAAFEDGGGAVDAAIAAQAVLCVLMPEACGLGGDGMALVHKPGEAVVAVGGSGDAAARAPVAASSGGASVTVPGVVAMWGELSRFAIRPLAENLDRALDLCESGSSPPPATTEARHAHRHRIEDGGGDGWAYINATGPVPQPELASVLELIGRAGTDAFYKSWPALAVAEAAQKHGGFVEPDDLERIRVCSEDAISVRWNGGLLAVQPPPSQGILLAMSALWFEQRGGGVDTADLDHLAIEATEGAFAYRDDCAKGQALLDEDLEVDEFRARRRGGPRSYLHTAGVATVDGQGTVVSSLVSVFDDFGSAVFVPECGFMLNNRAGGFTTGMNAFAPRARPVHTLAPAILSSGSDVVALATPGADGQVQTLLQLILAKRYRGRSLARAIGAPRWRSEGGRILIGEGHPSTDALAERGHHVVPTPNADQRMGAVVGAGMGSGQPFAMADWRRTTSCGAV